MDHRSTAAATNLDTAPAARRGTVQRGPLITILIIVAAVLLVVLPIAAIELPREYARWVQAAAELAKESGDAQRALELLDKALKAAGPDAMLLLRRAELRHELGNTEDALEDLRLAGTLPMHRQQIVVLVQRASVYQNMGRWDDAVADWKTIKQLAAEYPNTIDEVILLNGLSYARALANTELEEAYLDVDRAIREFESSPELLDTRGYVLYRRGSYELAQTDLDAAVEAARKKYSEWFEQYSERQQQFIDDSLYRQQDEAMRRNVAVILYHRALVNEKLEPSKAEYDYQEIRTKWKFEPGPQLF